MSSSIILGKERYYMSKKTHYCCPCAWRLSNKRRNELTDQVHCRSPTICNTNAPRNFGNPSDILINSCFIVTKHLVDRNLIVLYLYSLATDFFSCFRRCTRSKFKGRTVAASCLLRLPLRLPLTWSNHSSSGILTFRSPLIDYREEQITQTWCLICGTSNIKELSEFWIKNCFYFIGQWAQKVLTNS